MSQSVMSKYEDEARQLVAKEQRAEWSLRLKIGIAASVLHVVFLAIVICQCL